MKVTSWRTKHPQSQKPWIQSGRGGGWCWPEHLCKTTLLNVRLVGWMDNVRLRLSQFGLEVSINLCAFSPDHCMVNFIKENLLGSIKEFRNRFINPIQNGQCADSTLHDVRIMKKRAHILYEMLAGCVQVIKRKSLALILFCILINSWTNAFYFCLRQRKDYTALTKFLPPKHEYVLSVRVTPIQCKLYRYYLEHFTGENWALIYELWAFVHGRSVTGEV